ncbi:hypothetical protein [Streptomyces sp. NBC_01314]|uniref:hypothetical protein n=1 Tax=Streptomyces sp. NBC_01314 TaxID=2903821 RepID=UPI0030850389|nr:hypothetical protein OG622_31925 [Streptomyces sp. NBC_01314]
MAAFDEVAAFEAGPGPDEGEPRSVTTAPVSPMPAPAMRLGLVGRGVPLALHEDLAGFHHLVKRWAVAVVRRGSDEPQCHLTLQPHIALLLEGAVVARK